MLDKLCNSISTGILSYGLLEPWAFTTPSSLKPTCSIWIPLDIQILQVGLYGGNKCYKQKF